MKIFVLSGLALGVFCATASAQGAAQDVPAGYEEFTFKRIGAPNTTAAKRITVQIDPAAQARRLAGVLPPPENPIPRGGAKPPLRRSRSNKRDRGQRSFSHRPASTCRRPIRVDRPEPIDTRAPGPAGSPRTAGFPGAFASGVAWTSSHHFSADLDNRPSDAIR